MKKYSKPELNVTSYENNENMMAFTSSSIQNTFNPINYSDIVDSLNQ